MPAPRSTPRSATVTLDPDVEARLRRLAEAQRRSPDAVMRDAIADYLNREEKRAAFRRDAEKAWDEYRATGQHLTESEADAWLARLEAGQDVDPPECHG